MGRSDFSSCLLCRPLWPFWSCGPLLAVCLLRSAAESASSSDHGSFQSAADAPGKPLRDTAHSLAAKALPLADQQSAFCSGASLWALWSGMLRPGMLQDLKSPVETADPLQGGVQGMPHGLWCPFESDVPLQERCWSALHSLTGEWSFCCQELSQAQGARLSWASCCSGAVAASGPALQEIWAIYISMMDIRKF